MAATDGHREVTDRAAANPARRTRAGDGGARLGDGMTISADVSARLLGMRLLRVRANVVVAPLRHDAVVRQDAPLRHDGVRPVAAPAARPARLAPARADGGLAAATLALAAGADELQLARERMP